MSEISIQSSVFEIRVVVFIETAPQSNVYNQIEFNQAQFKKISDAIAKEIPPCNDPNHKHDERGCLNVPLADYSEVKLPTEIKSYYGNEILI